MTAFFPKILTLLLSMSIAVCGIAQTQKCQNIAIKEVKEVDFSSKYQSFEVTLENKGLRTIDLPNAKTLSLQFFWSGNNLYEAGDILAGGIFITNFGDYGKSLSPDGTHTICVKVPLNKKSRYLNNIVFVIDALFLYEECDELDNIKGIAVK